MNKYRFIIVLGAFVALVFAGRAYALTISNVQVQNNMNSGSISGAQITWTTDIPSNSGAYYGITSGSYTSGVSSDCYGSGLFTSHCVNLANLTPGATYYFQAWSNASGTLVQAPQQSFTAAAATSGGSTTSTTNSPPLAPSNLVATPSGMSVNLTWVNHATNATGIKIYRGPTWTEIGNITNPSITAFTDGNVSTGTYTYHINSYINYSGTYVYSSLSNDVSATVPGADTSPPTVPTNLLASPLSYQVALAWTASVDPDSTVAGYKIYRSYNGTWSQIGQSSSATYTDTSVSPASSYTYNVVAYDPTGNASSPSNNLSVNTPASTTSSDTISPTMPTNLVATTDNYNLVVLSWSASTDNFGVAGYRINRSFNGAWSQVGQTSGTVTTFSDYSVSPSSPYYYNIVAYDAASNMSSSSSNLFLNTPAGTTSTTTAPAAPTNLLATVSGSNVMLTWTDNSNNESGFKMYRGPTWTDIGNVGTNVTTFTDPNLAPGTYTYHLNAFINNSGTYTYSSISNDITVTVGSSSTTTATTTTSGSSDSIPPSTPGTLLFSAASTSIGLVWGASSDNVGVAGYRIFRNGTLLTSINTAGYTDNAVTAGSTYNYYVVAYDAAGNTSPPSNSITATVSGNTSGGPAINWFGYAWNPIYVTYGTNSANGYGNWYTDNNGYLKQDQVSALHYKIFGSSVPSFGDFDLQAVVSLRTGSEVGVCGRMDSNGNGYCYSTGWGGGTGTQIALFSSNNQNPTGISAGASLPMTLGIDYIFKLRFQGGAIYGKIFPVGSIEPSAWMAQTVDGTFTNGRVGFYSYGSQPTIKSVGVGAVGTIFNFAPATTTTVTATTTVTTVATTTTITGSLGACIVRDSYVSMPPGFAPNLGQGYAKIMKSGINTISGLQSSCSTSDYSNLIQAYCSQNSNPMQEEVATYDAYGNFQSTSCGAYGCSFISCPNSTSPNTTSTASSTLDTIPPSIPTGLVGMPASPYRIDLNWQPSFDNVGVLGYKIYQNGAFLNSVNGTSYSDTNLIPQSTYRYAVAAYDAAGNVSAQSFAISVMTPALGPDASVAVTVLDGSGNPVPNVGVHIFKSDFSANFGGVTGNQGTATISVLHDTYLVEVITPPDRTDLVRAAPISFNISSGDSKQLKIQLGSASNFISGTVAFSDGTPVTDAEVGAYSSQTNQWVSVHTDQNGNYSLKVGSGNWQVGIRPLNPANASWTWSGNFPNVSFDQNSLTQTKNIPFTVLPSGARLTVHLVDESGAAIDGGVVADTVSASTGSSSGQQTPLFQKTLNGVASFTLSAGTYYIRASLPPALGLLNPDEKSISMSSGASSDVTLVFKKQALGVTVRGTTKLDDGKVTDAFVWGWSDHGGFSNTRADTSGAFSFRANPGEQWHIGAGKEINGIAYKSSEIIISVGAVDASLDIVLSRLVTTLPPPVQVTESSAKPITAEAQDGSRVNIPAGAVSSGGNVNVQITPTIEAPSQPAAKVVGTVYDINVKDQSGNAVTQLQKTVEIRLPYDEASLKDQKIKEDNLVPSYFDDATGAWVKVDNYTIDKVNKVVILRVSHFTRFALVAAADTTPPVPPSSIRAKKGASGILVTWKNPKSDFDHIKIYRSIAKGDLGIIIGNDIVTAQFTDAQNLQVGTVYYYTVRAVDPAGNESGNQLQVSATAGAGASGKLLINLRQGVSGSDVLLLQQLLAKDGVYAGPISGYFGKLTKQAVIQFQEKYLDDILKPAGLDKGNGFVGAGTRAKLNQLIH